MDYDKLIEQLNAWNEQHLSVVCGSKHFACDYLCENEDCIVVRAATALSTLQAENEKLRAEVESFKKGHCAGCSIPAVKAEQIRDLTDAPKLRAELEQVKRERDAAVSWAQKYTESIDRPCVACKHNTGDYVCTAICGNCGPMGTESCKWEFDFSGELKED